MPHWTDLAVFTQPGQWEGFLSATVTAHEADIVHEKLVGRDHQEQVQSRRTDAERPQTRLSRATRRASCPSVCVRRVFSWVERIDQDFETMLRLAAQMQERDKDKFIAAVQQDCRLGAEKVAEFDKHIYLVMKRFTAGIAREIVDTSKIAGEAWYRLTDRFNGRNVQGATHCQSSPRIEATYQIAESFLLLNVIMNLVREFARQSPQAMPSATVKSACMRVVPETYRRAMETQVDEDKVEPHNLEDKALVFIRNNSSGAVPMDI